MSKVPLFHTNSSKYQTAQRSVHHNDDTCREGARILQKHRDPGTGGKQLCRECISLLSVPVLSK